jgi:hypothetical protein
MAMLLSNLEKKSRRLQYFATQNALRHDWKETDETDAGGVGAEDRAKKLWTEFASEYGENGKSCIEASSRYC